MERQLLHFVLSLHGLHESLGFCFRRRAADDGLRDRHSFHTRLFQRLDPLQCDSTNGEHRNRQFQCRDVFCQFKTRHNVRILGPINLPSSMPVHASQLYSKNILNLLALLIKDAQMNLNMEDEIVAGTLITHNGQVTNPNVKKLVEPAAEGVAP